MLLAVGGLSGCTFEPIVWDDASPEPTGTPDPGRVVGKEFFARSADRSAKTLAGGIESNLRISTAHFDGYLVARSVSTRLDGETAKQVRQRSAIEAPEGRELVAFVLRAGIPGFIESGEQTAGFRIINGDLPIRVVSPFGRVVGAAYEVPYVMFVLSVPKGGPVLFQVDDVGQSVTVDVRTAQPALDEGWERNAGFRKDLLMSFEPTAGTYRLPAQTVPSDPEVPIQRASFRLDVAPTSSYGLVPWNPQGGWAEAGRQWMRIQMNAEVSFESDDNVAMEMDLDVRRSFTFVDASGTSHAPQLPLTMTSEAIRRGQGVLDILWQVPADTMGGRILVHPEGRLQAHYSDAPTVPVTVSSTPAPLSFAVILTEKS